MEERVTIRELARLSGVSVGTVSRALNGYADVRPETRERIARLARELDYTPAAAARSLVTQRSHVIGVFLETGEGHPDLQHPFFHEVLGGLKQRVGARGLRPAAVRLRAPRERLRPALLSQARPPPLRRRRRAHGPQPRGPRGAPAGARRAALRGHRHRARGPAGRGRHVRQRGRRAPRRRASARAGAPPDRHDHRHARVARRAPTACAATAPPCRRPASATATSTWPTATSTPRAGASAPPGCSRCPSRRRRSSPPPT